MLSPQKRKGLFIANIWFHIPEEFSPKRYTVCRYQSMLEPVNGPAGQWVLGKRDARTLLSDLTLSPEELMQCCSPNVRTKLHRAAREGVGCVLYGAQDLRTLPDLLAEFDTAYAEMHRQKQMADSSVLPYLQSMVASNVLAISVAYIEGKPVAYHGYVTGDGIARLLYSVSVFRGCEDNALRNAIGRANRLLHYEDMLRFKELGYTVYDWGGYATDPALENINSFKAGFGGSLASRYNVTTTAHWLVAVGYRVWEKWRGRKK